jgi:hypothetical protein
MNAIKLIFLSLLVLIGNAARVRGEESPTDLNPALLYYQAFLRVSEVPGEDRDYLYSSNQWRGRELPERFGRLISGYDMPFARLRQAAKSTVPCDWGIDMSPGPGTLLMHLPRCKNIAVMVPLRVMWDLQNNRESDARDDLLATFALGRNASRDGTLIGVLVQFAIEHIVLATVAENFHRFSPETLRQLGDGFDASPPQGTVAASLVSEKTNFHDWFERKILEWQKENPGNDAEVMVAISNVVSGSDQTQQWQEISKAAGGTSGGILKLVHDEEPFYQRLLAIMASPPQEFEAQEQQFEDDVHQASNPLLSLMVTGVVKSRTKEFESRAKLAMVRAAIEYKLHGQQSLQAVSDPMGEGPFKFQRFVFQGVDRGFELQSGYSGPRSPFAMIFVETEGPPFVVDGVKAGQPPAP